MKTATKVFLILGIIGTGLSVLLMILLAAFFSVIGTSLPEYPAEDAVSMEDWEYVSLSMWVVAVTVIILAVPAIIFHVLGLKKLNAARCKADVPVWLGVCMLILGGNIIAGILMLCLSDSDFPAPQPAYGQAVYGQTYFRPDAGQPVYQPGSTFYQGNGAGYGTSPAPAPEKPQNAPSADRADTDRNPENL